MEPYGAIVHQFEMPRRRRRTKATTKHAPGYASYVKIIVHKNSFVENVQFKVILK